MESREDTYLVDPQLGGLSVKLRRGRALEVKLYEGSPGILEVAGRARGRLESWEKWSFPGDPPGRGGADLPGRAARLQPEPASGLAVGFAALVGRQ